MAELPDEQEPAASNMDWLDNLSESGSSNMSKIDWAAIERMVATGEAWAEEKLHVSSTLKELERTNNVSTNYENNLEFNQCWLYL